MKKLIGFCSLAAIIALLAIGSLYDPQPAPELEARTPVAGIERISQGLRVDRSLPDGQIWPWDNSGIQTWMDDQIAHLEPQITNPEYRKMAENLTIRSSQSDGSSLGLYYQPTYDAVGMIWENDDERSRAGLYILLHMAKADDAWAYYSLGNWVIDTGYAPENIAQDLYREAADREFLPSIVNLVIDWKTGKTTSREAHEAYFRYGFDLEATDGRWNLTNALIVYYTHDNPSFTSDGYLDRAMTAIRDEYGEEIRYHEDMGIRLDDGIDIEPDPAAAAQEFLKSIELGGTWALNRMGYKYMGGSERGVPYDKDLARDYFHACIVIDPNDYCAMNYGSLYYTPSRDSVDYSIAHAFYRYGVEMGGDNKASLLREIRTILPRMSTDDVARANRYYDGIARGDFSQIPHVKDARPVTQ